MTKTTLTAVALLGALGMAPANAADVYERGSLKDAPAPYAEPYQNWSGWYFGGNAGGVNDEGTDFRFAQGFQGDVDDFDDDDDFEFVGGVHAGYNWQWAQKVFGIEGDINFADGLDYLASIRGRLGFAITDNVLLYGTGGVAFLGLDDEFGFEDDDNKVGFVAGGGLEFKVSQNVSIGAEGLYYNFEDSEFDVLDTVGVAGESDVDFWTVRGRVTYHLGGGVSEALK